MKKIQDGNHLTSEERYSLLDGEIVWDITNKTYWKTIKKAILWGVQTTPISSSLKFDYPTIEELNYAIKNYESRE